MNTLFVQGESSNSSMNTLIVQEESITSSHFSYDVFLSFRGEDTRKNFTGHLYYRLCQAGVNTFIDDEELRKGDVISRELERAIQESKVSIVIFSRNYASSSWCVDELVKILEWKEKLKQIILPIFYDVEPTEVRKQTGEFGIEFAKLKERPFGAERMDKWKAALTEAANLSGWDLRNVADGHESKFIGSIIKQVQQEVKYQTPLDVASHPVGVDFCVEDIELLLQTGCVDEVRMIGIYGVGGIGKTTLAKAVYNRVFRHFDSSCFLSDVRSKAEELGLDKLQEKLLHKILKTKDFEVDIVAEGVNLIKARLESKKVLIILDDVDHRSQLESLARERSWFGSGSLIIITTRDKQLLCGLRENEKYKAKLLNPRESLRLFSGHAFKSLAPPQEFDKLAQDIIEYSGGLPLALVILGSHLQGRSIEEWGYEFKKLRAIPHCEIQKILKISFDGLDCDETKDVFLDIACAFHGFPKDEVTKILNACDFHTESAILTLVQRNLLDRVVVNLTMHDLVRDMGREIVRMESPRDPGKRSRLFNPQEIRDVLQGNKCCPVLKELNLSYCGKLRKTPKFNGAASLETLLLVACLSLEEIDQSICQLESLQVLDITLCSKIQTLPVDLGDVQSLRSLRAKHTDIKQLLESVEKLKNLETLELGCMNNGIILPLYGIIESRLTCIYYGLSEADIHVDIGSLSSLISLDLSGNSFHHLPFDFSKLRFLKDLRLNDCQNLQSLPSLSNLENLKGLQLRNCMKLVDIRGLDNLPSIKRIDMIYCSSLPNPINEGFFSAPALSIPSKKHPHKRKLAIYLQCNEIPGWCSNQVTAPSICLTVPRHDKEYKFLGMVLWFVCQPRFSVGSFVVSVSDRERESMPLSYNILLPNNHGELSCVHYISHLNRPFDGQMIKGGEKITVHQGGDTDIKKIGIHLLYLDQHGNVTSLPGEVDHSYSPFPGECSAGHKRAKLI